MKCSPGDKEEGSTGDGGSWVVHSCRDRDLEMHILWWKDRRGQSGYESLKYAGNCSSVLEINLCQKAGVTNLGKL